MHLHLLAQPGRTGLYSAAQLAAQYTASMADNKTQVTGVSADDFIAALEHPVRRQDGVRLRTLMAELTGQEPEM
jgi:hypothetical protein